MNENANSFDLLSIALKNLGLPFDQQTLEKFAAYYAFVVEWNEKVNLTSITDLNEFVLKHYIDSLMCADFDEMKNVNTIIDVGTGGGFPGIPLAIVYPEKQFFLLDSLSKRIHFLRETSAQLGLKNVTFGHGRAEDFGNNQTHRENYDLCVSRAVANLSVLSEYCLPFVKVGGYFAPYKTLSSGEEIQNSKKAIKLLGGVLEKSKPFSFQNIALEHQILYIKKVKSTPKQYPRKAGLPAKSPL